MILSDSPAAVNHEATRLTYEQVAELLASGQASELPPEPEHVPVPPPRKYLTPHLMRRYADAVLGPFLEPRLTERGRWVKSTLRCARGYRTDRWLTRGRFGPRWHLTRGGSWPLKQALAGQIEVAVWHGRKTPCLIVDVDDHAPQPVSAYERLLACSGALTGREFPDVPVLRTPRGYHLVVPLAELCDRNAARDAALSRLALHGLYEAPSWIEVYPDGSAIRAPCTRGSVMICPVTGLDLHRRPSGQLDRRAQLAHFLDLCESERVPLSRLRSRRYRPSTRLPNSTMSKDNHTQHGCHRPAGVPPVAVVPGSDVVPRGRGQAAWAAWEARLRAFGVDEGCRWLQVNALTWRLWGAHGLRGRALVDEVMRIWDETGGGRSRTARLRPAQARAETERQARTLAEKLEAGKFGCVQPQFTPQNGARVGGDLTDDEAARYRQRFLALGEGVLSVRYGNRILRVTWDHVVAFARWAVPRLRGGRLLDVHCRNRLIALVPQPLYRTFRDVIAHVLGLGRVAGYRPGEHAQGWVMADRSGEVLRLRDGRRLVVVGSGDRARARWDRPDPHVASDDVTPTRSELLRMSAWQDRKARERAERKGRDEGTGEKIRSAPRVRRYRAGVVIVGKQSRARAARRRDRCRTGDGRDKRRRAMFLNRLTGVVTDEWLMRQIVEAQGIPLRDVVEEALVSIDPEVRDGYAMLSVDYVWQRVHEMAAFGFVTVLREPVDGQVQPTLWPGPEMVDMAAGSGIRLTTPVVYDDAL